MKYPNTNTTFTNYFRLGSYCNPAVSGCNDSVEPVCLSGESMRCSDVNGDGSNYIEPDGAMAGGLVVTVLEPNTGLRRTIRLAPGGRVLPQP